MRYYELLLATIGIVLYIIFVELATRGLNIKQSASRKLLHVGLCFTVVGMTSIVSYKVYVYLGFVFSVGMIAIRPTTLLKSLLDRKNESYGEIMFPIGIALSALIADQLSHFIATVLVLGLADTVAYYAGNTVKSRALVGKKSLAGSVGFFAVSILILILLADLSVLTTILLAVVLTTTEQLSPYGSDNLTLPLVASVALSVLR